MSQINGLASHLRDAADYAEDDIFPPPIRYVNPARLRQAADLLAHWPETHPFKPDDAEHLRAWLYVKAGYRQVRHIDVDIANPKELAIALALAETILRTAKVHGFPRVHEQALVIFLPKSIAFDKLSHKAFCALDQDVADVIKAETGLDPDQLLKETEAAA